MVFSRYTWTMVSSALYLKWWTFLSTQIVRRLLFEQIVHSMMTTCNLSYWRCDWWYIAPTYVLWIMWMYFVTLDTFASSFYFASFILSLTIHAKCSPLVLNRSTQWSTIYLCVCVFVVSAQCLLCTSCCIRLFLHLLLLYPRFYLTHHRPALFQGKHINVSSTCTTYHAEKKKKK